MSLRRSPWSQDGVTGVNSSAEGLCIPLLPVHHQDSSDGPEGCPPDAGGEPSSDRRQSVEPTPLPTDELSWDEVFARDRDEVGKVLRVAELFFSPRLLVHPFGGWLARLGGVLGVLPSLLPLVLYCWYFVPLVLTALVAGVGLVLLLVRTMKGCDQNERPWAGVLGLFAMKFIVTVLCIVTVGSVGNACLLFYCRGEGYVSAARLDVQSRSVRAYFSSLHVGHYSLWDLLGCLL